MLHSSIIIIIIVAELLLLLLVQTWSSGMASFSRYSALPVT